LPNNVLQHGWYLWHWEGGANLIYWQQNNQQQIIGVELEPVRIKSDLISRLPNTVANNESTDNFRLRVLDTAGKIIYQWGAFSPSKMQALQQHSLSYPLSSWSVEYYGAAYSPAVLSRYSLLLTLAGFALLISTLAWFLYREQTREIRLATQRVQFVSQVSHELKTPLTNIRLYAEMLEDQLDDDPQQQRYLQVITDESQRLSRLIANVLNFSRKPRLHKREFELNTVIQQSIAHFKPSFAAKSIALNLDLQAMGSLLSDPDALEQIINNLLSNVEKYAADGKQVDISSTIDQQQFSLKIRDYGKGIARNERKRIFQPFYRINNQLTEGVSGTGIGLAIAKQQAELLGGSLELANVSQGTCFQLKLPL
ncbi:MAG: HAMP domain-containing histidine kinase, partial [Cocleimonas sp.]|nr:HAMP domain-containing histidine kinase [Cocleimonas sp.]